jgi:hypothetical protein
LPLLTYGVRARTHTHTHTHIHTHTHARAPTSAPPGCDVGKAIPIGAYLFNPMAANHSVNGQTFTEWFVDEYLFGPNGEQYLSCLALCIGIRISRSGSAFGAQCSQA